MSVQIILSNDQVKLSGNGFDFDFGQETLIINPLITVESIAADGVVSDKADSVLRNSGLVFGDAGDGVKFTGSNARVVNLAGGLIHGSSAGVSLAGIGSQVVTNNETIIGGGSGVSFSGGNNILLNNHGYIFGGSVAVGITSTSAGGTITNSGTIKSTITDFFIKTDLSLTTIISNTATGVISSPINAIGVKTGMLSLNNAGRIDGVISGGDLAHDSVVNSGKINGAVHLGSGNDVYKGTGNGSVTAGVFGGAGNDRFTADKAKEAFFGEADADTFVFASILYSPATAKRDTIGGFSHGDLDKINVHPIDADTTHAGNQNFAFIGTDSFAHYHSVHPGAVGMLRFDAATHRVQGNVNGDFAHADFEVNLPGVTALHASDFVL